MTLRDTELIGKKLVKHGFHRSNIDHHNYKCNYINIKGSITVTFKLHGATWAANFVHSIDFHTTIIFQDHQAVFTPAWVVEEHEKLQAMFKFIRS
jgi:hypothetical protein